MRAIPIYLNTLHVCFRSDYSQIYVCRNLKRHIYHTHYHLKGLKTTHGQASTISNFRYSTLQIYRRLHSTYTYSSRSQVPLRNDKHPPPSPSPTTSHTTPQGRKSTRKRTRTRKESRTTRIKRSRSHISNISQQHQEMQLPCSETDPVSQSRRGRTQQV